MSSYRKLEDVFEELFGNDVKENDNVDIVREGLRDVKDGIPFTHNGVASFSMRLTNMDTSSESSKYSYPKIAFARV